MFVYQGNFDWPGYAENETFTIIFPHGVVRANDPVYLFTQWTKDWNRVLKAKFFQSIVVSDVKQLSNTTDISFKLSGAKYDFAITTEQNYAKVKVDMSSTGTLKTFTLNRVWKPEGKVDHDAALRIWAGSIKFDDGASAVDEQAIVILPEDYKDGKPVISSWQWTKDSAGKAKTTAFKGAPLKFISSDDRVSKFAFSNVHDFTCSWNRKTEKLGLEIKKGGKQVSVGELNLRAKIEPKAHSFDSDDLVPPTKKEVEFRLPQPQATLPRVLDPMPFPKTLLETLKHGAAFIEQAGYLTVQAQNKFAALDVDFHKQTVLVETLKKDKKNLEAEIVSLTGQRNKANATIEQLNKQLADASKEYKDKVKQLNDRIEHLKEDDRFDHKVISKLQEDLNALGSEIACLNNDLLEAQREKQRLEHTIGDLREEVFTLVGKVLELENELKIQKEANGALITKSLELENMLRDSRLAVKALQNQLADANAENERTKTDLNNALKSYTDTKKVLEETETKLKAKTITLDETSAELVITKRELTDKTTEAETWEYRVDKADTEYQELKNAQKAINKKWTSLVDEYQKKIFRGETSDEQLKDLVHRLEEHKKTL
ncbi:uncharacterized protein FTJAE_12176 [Fusarium tjaetaba]|uniref:Uncharacterized protein n=1 Tax=Fusarium tjaetaba TaxID=1567544 RepID=A0A8H5QPG3_9HYPO|nr:uncharacterized protein FTJAE_12176 [Fusarium tjaetaba]KAF5618479.1 hypothetical protein FTJAE_12176 [Fusarium tjaetaba]